MKIIHFKGNSRQKEINFREDPRLGKKEKEILAYLLSLPSETKILYSEIGVALKMPADTVKHRLRKKGELVKYRYVKIQPHVAWYVCDRPIVNAVIQRDKPYKPYKPREPGLTEKKALSKKSLRDRLFKE